MEYTVEQYQRVLAKAANMKTAIDETNRRRAIQDAYNQAHGIVPKTVIKSVRDLIEISSPTAERKGRSGIKMTKAEKEKEITRLEKQMREAAKMMEFEYAAILRDQIIELRGNGT
jgi:excinuclease ABC subunit B